MIVDWHAHWLAPSTLDLLGRRTDPPMIRRNASGYAFVGRTTSLASEELPLASGFHDDDERFRHLDRTGIGHQLLSWPTTFGLERTLPVEELRILFSAYNDELAAFVARHPGRLAGVAALPTGDMEWSARELERAHAELGLAGAVLPAGGFTSLDAAHCFAPVLRAAQRHGSHLYLHTGPAAPSVPGQVELSPARDSRNARWLLQSCTQFASAMITLGLSDLLEAYPRVTVQVAMLGGTLPFLTETIAARARRAGTPLSDRPFARLVVDTGVVGQGPDAVAHTTEALGTGGVVFGTDYPLVPTDITLAAVRASRLAEPDKAAVLRGDAQAALRDRIFRLG